MYDTAAWGAAGLPARRRAGSGQSRPSAPWRRVPEAEAAFLAPPLARRRAAGTCLGGRSPAAPAAPPGTTQRASANVRANERLALPALWRLSRLCVSASPAPPRGLAPPAEGPRGRLCPFTPSFGRRGVSRKRRPGGRRAASRGAWGPVSAAGRAGTARRPQRPLPPPASSCPALWKAHWLAVTVAEAAVAIHTLPVARFPRGQMAVLSSAPRAPTPA